MAPRERIDRTAALLLAAAAAAALAAAGCSAEQYKKDADHEVAEILAKKQKDFHKFSEETGFTIEQAHDALRAQLVAALAELHAAHQGEPPVHHETNLAPPESSRDQADEALRNKMVEIRQERARHLAVVEKAHAADLTPFQVNDPSLLPARKIRLVDAVAIAAENNRDYQRQKEQVYLSALDLTFQRYQFENHYGVSSDYQWTSIDNPGDNGRTRQGSLTNTLSITRQLETGGLLVFDFTNSLLKNFTGITFSNGKDTTYGSLMDITFSQPLLRGAGFTIAGHACCHFGAGICSTTAYSAVGSPLAASRCFTLEPPRCGRRRSIRRWAWPSRPAPRLACSHPRRSGSARPIQSA
jgi:hypothetical protein